MLGYQKQFFDLAFKSQALQTGDFTLKSGRKSPYFFNVGRISSGSDIAHLGELYAEALIHSGIHFDMLFGPAYKGIPLVTTTAIALSRKGMDVPYCYNRKETKDHGEGGQLVGHDLTGDVVILDDVVTAGTAAREAIEMIQQAGARPASLLIALNRGEQLNARSGIFDDVPLLYIAGVDDLIEYLGYDGEVNAGIIEAIKSYREEYSG